MRRHGWNPGAPVIWALLTAAPAAAQPAGGSDKPAGYETKPVAQAPATADAPGAAAPAPLSRADREAVLEAFGGIKSETRPSKDAEMLFSFPTEVREVLVRDGQPVKRGDVMVRARDAELKAALEQQRLIAGSTHDIQARQQQMDLAQFRFDRLRTTKNYSPMEYEEAKIALETAKVQHGSAVLDHAQQQERLKQLQGQFERSYLEAPFDGIVEEVFVEVGQGVNEQQKALRIVDVSLLWLDAGVDTDETITRAIKPGTPAWVLMDLPTPALVEGRVLSISPVAESVGQTRRVRIEIKNTKGWPAGVPSRVRFTEPEPRFAQYKVMGAGVSGVISAPEGRRVVATGAAKVAEGERAEPVEGRATTARLLSFVSAPEGAEEFRDLPLPLRGSVSRNDGVHGLRSLEDSLAPPVATTRGPFGAKGTPTADVPPSELQGPVLGMHLAFGSLFP